jgi:hypothetical protein
MFLSYMNHKILGHSSFLTQWLIVIMFKIINNQFVIDSLTIMVTMGNNLSFP